jgi:hypothetical protein
VNSDSLSMEESAALFDGGTSHEPARDSSCTIIGPSNAGKTTFLVALQQACLQSGEDEFDLDFLADNEQTLQLLRLASDLLFDGLPMASSSEVVTYAFRVQVKDRRCSDPEFDCSMCVTDGPGGHLLPQERGARGRDSSEWDSLIAAARGAHSLVLCVDASAPQLAALYCGLPELITAMKQGERRLPHRRVLLLLTKIDLIIDAFVHSARGSQQDRMRPGRVDAGYQESATIARMLSPLGQAEALLGKIVEMIRAGVRSDAVFAVGACSALGLQALQTASRRKRGGLPSVAERLATWSPFGVREALLFLAAGDIRHPIERVPPRGQRAMTLIPLSLK